MRSKNDASSKLVSDRHTAIYARDGAVQPSGSNLEAQVEACVRQVAEDRVPAVDAAYVFRDQQSGAELDRPGLHGASASRAGGRGEFGVCRCAEPFVAQIAAPRVARTGVFGGRRRGPRREGLQRQDVP